MEKKYALPLVLTGALLLCAVGQNVFAEKEKTDFRLQVLHSSDNESSFQDPSTLEPKILHYTAILEGLRKLAQKENMASLYVTAGDHTLPGPFYDAAAQVQRFGASGIGDIEIFNATGLAANGMGNHEFDGGIEDFARMLQKARYPFVAVNLDFSHVRLPDGVPAIRIGKDAGSIEENAGKVARSAYAEIGGEKIGIIGRAPADFFNVIKDPDVTLPGLDFFGGRNPENSQPLVSATVLVLEQVKLLEAQGINKIILLDHSQDYTTDPLSVRLLRGIDMIVMAGATGFMARAEADGPFNLLRQGDSPLGSYPDMREDSEGRTVLIVNTDQQYRYAGNLMVTFDGQGHIKEIDPRSGPVPASAEGVAALEKVLGQSLSPPFAVEEIFSDLKKTKMIQEQFQTIGITEMPLNGIRADVRSRETNLGHLTAVSALWYAREVMGDKAPDIALKNGGGIRDSIPGPHITRLSIAAALPFDNKMAVVELKSPELLAVMENAVSRYPHKDGRFPQIAGMMILFDPDRPGISDQTVMDKPSRIRQLRIVRADGSTDALVENFELRAEPERSFKVLTNDFLFTGGDGYHALRAVQARGKEMLELREQEILARYIREVMKGNVNVSDPRENPSVMCLPH
ncbi:MAG: bifunctional metallophosphatase/5'-nucleotidase [Desulfobacterales bacterium]